MRAEELRQAAKVLGVAEVVILDHPDGDLRSYAYLVAAPAPMVDATAQTLDAAGVPEQQVSADRISGY